MLKTNNFFEKCIVIGSGQFAYNCAKYLQDIYQLDCVWEYGNYMQSRLEVLCKKSNFPYTSLANKAECDKVMADLVKSRKTTLIISASNIYIFPKFITECKNVVIINYHPALLTRHLGRNTEAWAIYEQDRETGVTWHEVTSEIDHGEIIAQKSIELDKDITAIKLMIKQYQIGFELFKEFIGSILKNENISKSVVSDYGKLHYSYEAPNDGILDLTWNEDQISAFLRSMDYGALNVMKKPLMIENNLRYSWDSYKILEKEPAQYDFDSKTIERENLVFVLQKIHLINDI